LGKVKKANSLTASIALCALIPLNFLTAQGHTLPESQSSADMLRNSVEDNRPALTLPENGSKTALLPPAAVNAGSADASDAGALSKPLQAISVVTTRETGHASVYINQREVIKFRADAQNAAGVWQTPTERAMAAYNVLKASLAKNGNLDGITPVVDNGRVYLSVHGQRFAEVDSLTARQIRTTPYSLALVWTSRVKQAAGITTATAKLKTPVKTAQTSVKSSPMDDLLDGSTTLKSKYLSQGKASWYGPGFHGRRAANGTIFNQFAMTAAHKTLPFGTLVRVTNKANGKQCVVKITDRGPFCGGRVIDLSRRAAESLGMLGSGVASVSLEKVS
jgi:rare lipoprotein A (peptidoglycan hydrolase)